MASLISLGFICHDDQGLVPLLLTGGKDITPQAFCLRHAVGWDLSQDWLLEDMTNHKSLWHATAKEGKKKPPFSRLGR